MAVRAVHSHKGGVGKSTICAAIAGELAARGRSVLIVDCDRNHPFRLWQNSSFIPQEIEVVAIGTVNDLYRAVEIGKAEFDETLIDLPAGASELALNAIALSDAVLVPFRAGPLDVEEAIRTHASVLDFALKANQRLPLVTCIPMSLNAFARHERIPRESIDRIQEIPGISVTYGTTERTAYRALFDPILGGRTLQTMPETTTGIDVVRLQVAHIVSDLDDRLLRHREGHTRPVRAQKRNDV
ncbi:ParA-like protein [Fulvimarina pelagi HTCC2506]|uniref:ParA-like protein n=1 Tax=Fulvimarina pelagi HTCC2506 TaxID=314231 RepID=Q0G2K5_9HYPH|nr:ParA-like protein [Fulvimarina pelagi HTCC2506]